MKRTLFPTLILVLLAVLLISLPLVAQAAEVPWNSECLAFQSGYHDHDWRWQSEEAATCQHGKVTHYKCKNCGNTCTVSDNTLAPHVFPSTWSTVSAATCTQAGTDIHYCTVCKRASETRNVPALGHDWGEWQTVTEPTCTNAGTKVHSCSRCRERETWSIPALGHNYQRSVAQQPTCTSDGMAIYRCSRCGDSYREPIPATGHSWQNEHKDATCTAAGYDRQKCSKCGAIQNEKTLPATGHKWGAWQQGEAATCVQYGNRYHDCTKCGAREWERDYASGLGDHDWGEWVTVKEPTATEDGLKERVCKVDASHKEQEVIPATGEPAEEAKPALELDMGLWVPELWVKGSESGSWVPNPDKEAISFEDEIWLNYYEVTNTGNVPLYYKVVVTTGNNVVLFDTGETSRIFSGMLNPGEHDNDREFSMYFYAGEEHIIPDPEDSPYAGTYRVTWIVYGYALDDTERTTPICKSNAYTFECKIAKQEEEKPALKLVVDQLGKEKEAYEPYDPKNTWGNEIWQQFIITNTGNVTLRYKIVGIAGNNVNMEDTHPELRRYFSMGPILPPGYTDYGIGSSSVEYHYIVGMDGMIPDPEDSPYAGTDRVSYMVYGYAVDDTELTTPICQDGPVVFEYKIAKNVEPEDLGDSLLTVDIYEYGSDDPAGYQLGEGWDILTVIRNKGSVDIDDYTVYFDYVASDPQSNFGSRPKGSGSYEVPRWMSGVLAVGYAESINITWTYGDHSPWGYITEEDVERGYVYVSAYVKWTDPDTGKERQSSPATLILPILSKTGLLLNKSVANTPAEGYFKEGDQIEWSLSMKNNSKEPIKDITITDKGATIGMFAEFTPEQGEIKLGVPKYTVTEYDVKVTGQVINYAIAKGTDLKGVEHTYTSNTATAKTKADTPEPFEPGGGGDPLGPVYDVHPAVSIIKAEAHKAASGDWYALDEMIDYTITVKNTGDTPLTNVQVYDSLGGFVPIGSCASLAVNEEKTFTFSWKTTQYDVDVTGYVVNQATVTYDFLGSIHGTPMTSNKVYVKAGENGYIPIIDGGDGHFDPEILHTAGDSCCALTLQYACDGTAYYEVTLCGEHRKVLDEAKAAADTGDWAKAVELIRTALDEFYGVYYEAADDEAKAAVINERLAFYAHVGSYQTLAGDRAAAEKLMLKLIQMCCMANTAQETLPDSLVNVFDFIGISGMETKAGRYIGLFDGKDEVTEGYEGPDARALNDVIGLLREAKSYDFNDVFERGQILWQASLDESVNAIYKAADREQRKLIAAWRISLDTLYHGERPFLELLYPANDAVTEEVLMNLYKDTAMDKEQIR